MKSVDFWEGSTTPTHPAPLSDPSYNLEDKALSPTSRLAVGSRDNDVRIMGRRHMNPLGAL